MHEATYHWDARAEGCQRVIHRARRMRRDTLYVLPSIDGVPYSSKWSLIATYCLTCVVTYHLRELLSPIMYTVLGI